MHASGAGVGDAPDFDAGTLSAKLDVVLLAWAHKKQREILRGMSCYAGAVEAMHLRFSPDLEASFAVDDAKLKITTREDIKDIFYTPRMTR